MEDTAMRARFRSVIQIQNCDNNLHYVVKYLSFCFYFLNIYIIPDALA